MVSLELRIKTLGREEQPDQITSLKPIFIEHVCQDNYGHHNLSSACAIIMAKKLNAIIINGVSFNVRRRYA